MKKITGILCLALVFIMINNISNAATKEEIIQAQNLYEAIKSGEMSEKEQLIAESMEDASLGMMRVYVKISSNGKIYYAIDNTQWRDGTNIVFFKASSLVYMIRALAMYAEDYQPFAFLGDGRKLKGAAMISANDVAIIPLELGD